MARQPCAMESMELSMSSSSQTSPMPSSSFWQGKRVVVTGHTGFKGAWLCFWLNRLGAKVCGLSLAPNTTPSLFELLDASRYVDHNIVDIRDGQAVKAQFDRVQPDIVFHLAAQALVRASYASPVDTFAANVMGTAHVLDALRGLGSCKAAVMITTDKVYRNREWHWPYRETDALGGHDPYSASKAACEIVIDSYRRSFLASQGLAVASARAGNVIGGGDWSADRLLPDAVRAWLAGQELEIRNPHAVRPWQHVLEPLRAYLLLAEKLCLSDRFSEAYNFGPGLGDIASVRNVIDIATQAFPGAKTKFGSAEPGPHEATLLSLDTSKAVQELGIRPRTNLEQAVTRTVNWYKKFNDGASAQSLCADDLNAFESMA